MRVKIKNVRKVKNIKLREKVLQREFFCHDPHLKANISIQISNMIRCKIMAGEIREGEMLPSANQLAKILKCHDSRVHKAYHDLETLGLLTRGILNTKFWFVAKDATKKSRTKFIMRLAARMFQVAKESQMAGLTEEDISFFISTALESDISPYDLIPEEIEDYIHEKYPLDEFAPIQREYHKAEEMEDE